MMIIVFEGIMDAPVYVDIRILTMWRYQTQDKTSTHYWHRTILGDSDRRKVPQVHKTLTASYP